MKLCFRELVYGAVQCWCMKHRYWIMDRQLERRWLLLKKNLAFGLDLITLTQILPSEGTSLV